MLTEYPRPEAIQQFDDSTTGNRPAPEALRVLSGKNLRPD